MGDAPSLILCWSPCSCPWLDSQLLVDSQLRHAEYCLGTSDSRSRLGLQCCCHANIFQSTIPREMEEAAIVDGCSDFRLFMQIVLPLSTPIIAVMALFYGVGHWNSFLTH